MGLTTASLHLYARQMNLDSAAAALRSLLSASGDWIEDPTSLDRVLVLLPPDSTPWLSLYDTGLPTADSLAQPLSRSLHAPVVAISVEDSDRCSATLYNSGKRIDRLAASVLRRRGSGHPEKWIPLLPHVSVPQLAEAMQGGGTFAEDALRRAAEALHLPSARVLATPEDAAARPPASALVLAFRSAHPATAPAGLPRLILGTVQALPTAAGQPFHILLVQVANRGPQTRGVRVRLGGAALEQGLLAPEAITYIRNQHLSGGTSGGMTEDFPLVREGSTYTAVLSDALLPCQEDPLSLRGATRRRMAEWMQKSVHFALRAYALKPGEAPLLFQIESLEAPSVTLDVSLPIQVTAPV